MIYPGDPGGGGSIPYLGRVGVPAQVKTMKNC